MAEPKKLRHRSDHRAHRADAYPPIGDQLDAIARGFQALISGEPMPREVHDWLASRAAVKTRFRKP